MHAMGDFVHIGVISQHPPMHHLGVGMTKLLLLVVIHLLLLLVMVEVVWVLGPITSPPVKLMLG